MTRLNGTANAQVAREIQNVDAVLAAERERTVARPIINDKVVKTCGFDALDDGNDGLFLIVCGYYNESAQG